MAFNNPMCPCGDSKVYSFNTDDGVENTRCSLCLSKDGYWDEDNRETPRPATIVPAPSIHSRIQAALGALVVEGGLTDVERMYLAELAETVNTNSIREALLEIAKVNNQF